jgi:hypothetical protein
MLAGLTAGALLLDATAYLFTGLQLGFHLRSSCDRLVLQSAWVAVLALGLAVGAESRDEQPPPAEGNSSAHPGALPNCRRVVASTHSALDRSTPPP